MLNSFYTAATGAMQLQKGFDVTANNVANLSTTGYKSADATFADLVDTKVHALEIGNGARLQDTSTVFQKGNLSVTNNPYDFALTDPHTFFAVQEGTNVYYTQSGSFRLSAETDGNYLVTSGGAYVLNANGGRIKVNNKEENLNVGVFTFANCDALVREGDTRFSASSGSGQALTVGDGGFVRGSVESSAVDFTEEMTSVIELQRAFQMNSKMIQISDEATETINKLG